MKRFYTLLFIFITLNLFSQDFELIRTVDRVCQYDQSSVTTHGNRLFVNANGALEVYSVSDEGHLNLEAYQDQYYFGDAVQVMGDSLYLLTRPLEYDNTTTQQLLVYDISDDNFTLTNEFLLNNDNPSIIMKSNNKYLFYNEDNSVISHIRDRHTLQEIGQIDTGHFFGLYNNYLFSEFGNGSNSAIQILDISDVLHPVQLAFLILSDNYEQDWSFNIRDNYLFITRNWSVQIIDISDISNPVFVSEISDIPYLDTFVSFIPGLFFKDNYIIFYDQKATVWVYDITNISNPTYITTFHELESFINDWAFMAKKDDFLLSATTSYNVSSFGLSNLPIIDYLDSTPQNGMGFWNKLNILNTRLIFSYNETDIQQSYFLNINNENSVPSILNVHGFLDYYPTKSDTLVAFKTLDNFSNINLSITKFHNDSLLVLGQIPYSYSFGDKYNVIDKSLLMLHYNEENVDIFSLHSNDFLQQIGNINFGFTHIKMPVIADDFFSDYLFFTYMQNNQNRMRIYENQAPFNQISDFQFSSSGSHTYLYFLTDHLVLKQLSHSIQLLSYNFPDQLEVLDSNSNYFTNLIGYSDSLICEMIDYAGNVGFLPINDNYFGEVFNYDFGHNVFRVAFYPEQHKFYAIGKYYLQEYSYQLDGADDDFITPISKTALSNYPNPFNPSTTISFSSAKAERNTKVIIYNLKGQRIREIEVTNCKEGKNKIVWNGKDDRGKKVTSGVYLYQLKQTGKTIATKKMIMVK